MERTWTAVGEPTVLRVGGREAVEKAIDELVWEGTDVGRGFSQAYAIRCLIAEYGLPRVSRVADSVVGDGGEDNALALYGVECRYANGPARVFALDTGMMLVPVCSDHEKEG